MAHNVQTVLPLKNGAEFNDAVSKVWELGGYVRPTNGTDASLDIMCTNENIGQIQEAVNELNAAAAPANPPTT